MRTLYLLSILTAVIPGSTFAQNAARLNSAYTSREKEPPSNRAPAVFLDNALFWRPMEPGHPQEFSVQVTDPNCDAVSFVKILVDGDSIGFAKRPDLESHQHEREFWTAGWQNPTKGVHLLSARAADRYGRVGTQLRIAVSGWW